jgi:hypothetical protein
LRFENQVARFLGGCIENKYGWKYASKALSSNPGTIREREREREKENR